MASDEHFAGVCAGITASWWTLFVAILFGKKVCAIDDWAGERTIITGYRWRGKLYVTRFDRLNQEKS